MKVIDFDKHYQPIIGRRGENKVSEAVFSIAQWREAYGSGTVQLLVQRCGDEIPYLAAISVDGDTVHWPITATETSMPGIGHAELRYLVGEQKGISQIYEFIVAKSLSDTEEEPPDAWESWFDRVLEATRHPSPISGSQSGWDIVQQTGSNTDQVMSQNATTIELNKKANSGETFTASAENGTLYLATRDKQNLFSFATAHNNFGVIGSHSITESASYGTKDAANHQFIAKGGFNSATFGISGGVATKKDGWYQLKAKVKVPTAGAKVAFGAKPLSSYVGSAYWDTHTIANANEWTEVSYTIQIANEQTEIIVCMMSENNDDISYWKDVIIVRATDYSEFDDSVESANVLYKKKWAVCGDSFSANGYNAEDGFAESVYKYQDGRFKGRYKVYGNMIGLRNEMDIDMLAQGGQTLTSYGGENSFMNVYQNIPTDADYITIMLGGNDKGYATSHGIDMATLVGSIDDTGTTTIYGAFNTALSHIVQNHPFAHIGIIVEFGTNAEIMAATIAAARKWGIPYLNMGSDQVPMVPRYTGKESYVCQTVLDFVQNNYTVRPGYNTHPNTACHKYMSTFIEAWLRTL